MVEFYYMYLANSEMEFNRAQVVLIARGVIEN